MTGKEPGCPGIQLQGGDYPDVRMDIRMIRPARVLRASSDVVKSDEVMNVYMYIFIERYI